MKTSLATPADTTESAPEPVIHALYSSWSQAECHSGTGWCRAFYVGGITCPACLAALPTGAAGVAAAVAS